MGVVNVTPDSFSDGGRFRDPRRAVAHAMALAESGADILDIGGESTRPGAEPVSEAEELDRVLPVVEELVRSGAPPVSVDTSSPAVMTAAARAGAAMINDVRALQRPGALQAAAESRLTVCLMHMQGNPGTMQQAPRYSDVLAEVSGFLACRARAAIDAGVGRESIVLDPGFGFGKTLVHNIELLRGIGKLCGAGFPVLAGLSRKSMIARILGSDSADRVIPSVTLALLAWQRGASILRVHDVVETVAAIRTWLAVADSAAGDLI